MSDYGPNTALVERVIEQAKTMTPEQAEALEAAWIDDEFAIWNSAKRAARRDAYGVARRAAHGAGRDTAWYAARGASWKAGPDDAWFVTWNTAAACIVRDLITPEQFDTLTETWVSVFGPLDDDDMIDPLAVIIRDSLDDISLTSEAVTRLAADIRAHYAKRTVSVFGSLGGEDNA